MSAKTKNPKKNMRKKCCAHFFHLGLRHQILLVKKINLNLPTAATMQKIEMLFSLGIHAANQTLK